MTESITQPLTRPVGAARVTEIAGVDLSSPLSFAGGPPHEAFDKVRAVAPVSWQDEEPRMAGVTALLSGMPVPESPGFWSVLGHPEAMEILRDPATFSSEAGGVLMESVDEVTLAGLRLILINMDDPSHKLQRKLLTPAFTPRLIDEMSSEIRATAKALAVELAEAGGGDFVSMVAVELTTRTLASLLGIPQEERFRVLDWARISDVQKAEIDGDAATVVALMDDLFAYARGVRAARRADPGDDLMSWLANAEVDGEEFGEDEFCWFYLMLIIAGTETTRYSLSGAMLELDRHGLWRRIADGSLPVSAQLVDEVVRFVSPVMHLRRTAMRDVSIGGAHVRAGDKVVVWMNAANRDPRVFSDPHAMVVDREPNPHLVFGFGAHYCLGTRLARLQIATMLTELAAVCPDLRVISQPRWMVSNFLSAVDALEVSV